MTRQLFDVGETVITVGDVVSFVVIIVVSYIISRLLQNVVARTLDRGGLKDPGTISTLQYLLHYVVMLVGLAVAVQAIGISMTSLFATGAVVAVAIGFALQGLLQNFVSGVILLAERSITEHDILELQDGQIVVVEKLGARATVVRTRDGNQLIIPNSLLVQASVSNFTLGDDTNRIRTRVRIAYGSDTDEVERVLLAAGASVSERDRSREPAALLLEFGESAVIWEVSIWTSDPWRARFALSALNKAIANHLKAEGIAVAFPQLDVHMVEGRPVDQRPKRKPSVTPVD